MDELKRKFEELEAKTKQLEADNAKLSADVKTGEEAKANIEKKFAEEKQKIRNAEDKSFIEKFKVNGVIVPAIEKEVTALLSATSGTESVILISASVFCSKRTTVSSSNIISTDEEVLVFIIFCA